MTKEEKLISKLADKKYVNDVTEKFLKEIKTFQFSLFRKGDPVNYVRERYTSRGHRFYNKKEAIMKEMNELFMGQVPEDFKEEFVQLKKESIYYVDISADFFVKIPKADSVETVVLKENKIIRPAITPDVDNFVKLLVDTLHNVIFDDDKRVLSLDVNKYYSINPRTEVKIKIEVIKK